MSGASWESDGRPAVREAVLDNGLKVLVQEVHTAPLASVWCWYKVGSKDEGPGLTGVSHWVEHMNFKGTDNIPRDQVKGIIEQFGGHLERLHLDRSDDVPRDRVARRARSHALHRGRADGSCLYDPDDCESERTVIISELKGGENDPEQLLDIELTAAAFRVHPYRHPTIGWLPDLETMTRDDLLRPLPALLHARTTPRSSSSATSTPTMRCAGSNSSSGRSRPTACRRGARRSNHGSEAERRVTLRKEGTTAYWKAVFHAPGVRRARLLPDAGGRRGAERGRGTQPLVGRAGGPAAAQRAAVSARRRQRAGVGGRRRPHADGAAVSLLVSATVSAGHTLAAVEDAVLDELERIVEKGITDAELAQGEGPAPRAVRLRHATA